jgi:hypothetical protein
MDINTIYQSAYSALFIMSRVQFTTSFESFAKTLCSAQRLLVEDYLLIRLSLDLRYKMSPGLWCADKLYTTLLVLVMQGRRRHCEAAEPSSHFHEE